jgi:hypothetical protein
MLARFFFYITDSLKINYKLHKSIIWRFVLCILLGVILGIFTIYTRNVGVYEISSNFVDQNIINSAKVNSTIGEYMAQRVISLFLPLALLFVMSIISAFTAGVVFPYMVLQGYWFVITIWWTIQRYVLGSVALLSFYAVWLLLMMTVTVIAVIWLMPICTHIRKLGFRCGFNQKETWRGILILLAVQLIFAVIEYLVYWVFLARIVYG